MRHAVLCLVLALLMAGSPLVAAPPPAGTVMRIPQSFFAASGDADARIASILTNQGYTQFGHIRSSAKMHRVVLNETLTPQQKNDLALVVLRRLLFK